MANLTNLTCPGDSAGAGCSTWTAQCINILQSAGNPSSGMVDQYGRPTHVLNNQTWGITYDTCNQYCNSTAIPISITFDYESFSGAMTNYFLPWIALAAQLPYENSRKRDAFMSFCLALGSPALVTYSLMITLLNRNWLYKHFKDLLDRTSDRTRVDLRAPMVGARVRYMLYMLAEAQQVPLRVTQVDHWLVSLILSPQNQNWWKNLTKRLEQSRRGVSFSLVAQILLALFVWILTIVSSLLAATGKITTALQIAAATLWVWLIPITGGWIAVGTQNHQGTIEHALYADPAHRIVPQGNPDDELRQEGIQVRSGLTSQPRTVQTSHGTLAADRPLRTRSNRNLIPMVDMANRNDNSTGQNSNVISPPSVNVPPTWLLDVRGDERLEGPIFNYARVFTWWKVSTVLHDSFAHMIENIENARPCTPINAAVAAVDNTSPREWQGDEDLVGNTVDSAAYCGLQSDTKHRILAYAEDTKPVWSRILVACLAGLFMQWSTTGPAIIMAYNTPTVGLSCRSGGYMIYGIVSTVVLFLLIVSMLLSHSAMRTYQDQYSKVCSGAKSGKPTREGIFDDFLHRLVCVLAVVTRALGKTLAFANMVWLIMSTIFEYIGFYNNCWCKSCFANLHHHGWATLFKTDDDFKKVAQGPWIEGVALSTIAAIFGFTFFAIAARRNN